MVPRLWISVLAVAGLVAAGCTTVPVRPAIKDFTDGVTTAAGEGRKRFEADKLDDRAAVALREEMAAEHAIFGIDSPACEPSSPFRADPTQPAPQFRDNCRIVSCTLGADGNQICEPPALPSYDSGDLERAPTDRELVNAEVQARRSLDALERYAEALSVLIASKAPAEVAMAASNAVAAVGGAAATAAEFAGAPIPSSFKPVITTGGALISTLTEEALEARRYALLASIVRSADPTVTELSRRVSTWFFLAEAPVLDERYKTLRDAINAATPGTVADLLAVDQARDAAVSADEKAAWRVFWQVAVAHNAILESLDAPADFDRLMAANQRIQNLVDDVQAFTGAVKKFQE